MAPKPHINAVTKKLSACASALEDLEHIYSDKFLTDVELKTKTNSFPAHKIVLCARSPVFKLMFSNDMRETNSNLIQVDDLEDGTVQQLLLFLYSDKIEDLEWDTATALYYAADKYNIEKLKLMCSSFLIDNISTSTVTELLVLADTHCDSDLLRVVEKFILDHEEIVFCLDKWERLMEANPQLALKAMNFKYKTKKKYMSKSDHSQSDEMVRHMKVVRGPEKCLLCDECFANSELHVKHLAHRHIGELNKKGVKDNDSDRARPSEAIRPTQREDVPKEKREIKIGWSWGEKDISGWRSREEYKSGLRQREEDKSGWRQREEDKSRWIKREEDKSRWRKREEDKSRWRKREEDKSRWSWGEEDKSGWRRGKEDNNE